MISVPSHVQGLQEKIKLVPIDLGNRPAWYKEKVYPENKVTSSAFFSLLKRKRKRKLAWVRESENFYQHNMGNLMLKNHMKMTQKF